MARGKHHRPLYELIGRAPVRPVPGQASPRPGQPTPHAPHATSAAPAADPAPPASDSPADAPAIQADRARITFAISTFYTAIAFVMVLMIVAYAVGYQVGSSASTAPPAQPNDLTPLGLADVRPPDSSQTQTPTSPLDTGISPNPNPTRPIQPQPTRQPLPQPPPANPAFLGPAGPLANDPRENGLNYLVIVLLDRERAERALAFLAAQGVNAMAERVDRGARAENTSALYRLVALDLAVPGDRFRATSAERQAFEARIREVGRLWTQEGGASDFSDPVWAKHDR